MAQDGHKLTGSEELANRLRAALVVANKKPAELAREMGETRQTVNSWLKTGRIKKSKLPKLAVVTAQSTDYYLGAAPMTAQEKREFDLVQAFRQLPEPLRETLLQQAKAMRDALAVDHQPPKRPGRTRRGRE